MTDEAREVSSAQVMDTIVNDLRKLDFVLQVIRVIDMFNQGR